MPDQKTNDVHASSPKTDTPTQKPQAKPNETATPIIIDLASI